MIVFLILYNALYTPFRVAFHTTPTSNLLYSWEIAVDFIFLLDVLFSFFIPYQRIDGSLEFDNMKIAKRYTKTWLMTDMFVIMPTNFIYWDTAHEKSLYVKNKEIHIMQALRLLRLVKILKLRKYLKYVTKRLVKKVL